MKIKQLNLQDVEHCLHLPENDEVHVFLLPAHTVDNLHKSVHEASHSLLLRILSAYTGKPAESLAFSKGPHGKPALISDGIFPLVQFNLSHSGAYIALAFSSYAPVGIDIEDTSRNARFDQVAARVFLPEEAAALARLPEEEKRSCFFRLWTRTESFLKGLGTGLSVSFSDKKIQKEYSFWTIEEIPAPAGYICTVSYRQEPAL